MHIFVASNFRQVCYSTCHRPPMRVNFARYFCFGDVDMETKILSIVMLWSGWVCVCVIGGFGGAPPRYKRQHPHENGPFLKTYHIRYTFRNLGKIFLNSYRIFKLKFCFFQKFGIANSPFKMSFNKKSNSSLLLLFSDDTSSPYNNAALGVSRAQIKDKQLSAHKSK